ncbi:lipocalin family protein [Mucilaginibacter psychrotolerans]|uniref:Lipocalin/cytosolic fatty-acid binding domain-containing protein n=1 Tax=Mucilaginibacter psychrotolerans TaxID=1524096 RepID=A0A4Y8S4Y0_9SPHI|nr:lipocalin family protein [Mucilaginibacter psychrotolerans]TFF33527.1 hypothetical protein E2R66_25470 [Mucilaginibacter psychrotolerans]
MRAICTIAVFLLATLSCVHNSPVERVDIKRFAGNWYLLYSIPTIFDKGRRETTTAYNWNADKQYCDLLTTCKKKDGATQS